MTYFSITPRSEDARQLLTRTIKLCYFSYLPLLLANCRII